MISLKILNRKCLLLLVLLLTNIFCPAWAQGPPPPPGSTGGGQAIGVPLDTDAIFILIAGGILYLIIHYRHLFLKREAINE